MRYRKTTMKKRKKVRKRKRRKRRNTRHRLKRKNRGGITQKDLEDAKKIDKLYNPRTSIRTTVRRKRKLSKPRTSIRTAVKKAKESEAARRRRTAVELEELDDILPRLDRRETIIPQNFWIIPWDSENPLSGLSPLSDTSDSIYALSDMSLPSANYSQ